MERKLLQIASAFADLALVGFGFAGVFTVFTYIQPILTRVSGFAESAVSPILLVFGAGMIGGNLLGGRFDGCSQISGKGS